MYFYIRCPLKQMTSFSKKNFEEIPYLLEQKLWRILFSPMVGRISGWKMRTVAEIMPHKRRASLAWRQFELHDQWNAFLFVNCVESKPSWMSWSIKITIPQVKPESVFSSWLSMIDSALATKLSSRCFRVQLFRSLSSFSIDLSAFRAFCDIPVTKVAKNCAKDSNSVAFCWPSLRAHVVLAFWWNSWSLLWYRPAIIGLAPMSKMGLLACAEKWK